MATRVYCSFDQFYCLIRALVISIILVPLFSQAQTNCLPAPSGLVAWWSAEDNADDQAQLSPGTLQGGVTFEAGAVGQAFAFHGGVDAVKILANPSLDVGAGNGLTVETWIYPRDLADRSPLVEWNREGTTSTEWGVHLWISRAGDFVQQPGSLFANLMDSNGTAHYLFSQGGVILSNVWQHVALTYDKSSGVARLYRNGEVVLESNVGIFTPETRYNLFLGRRPAGDSTMSYLGLLDEAAIYDHPLAQTELQAIYDAGAAGKCPLNTGGNRSPSISAIPNQSIVQGTSTGPLPFTISDAEAPPDNLVLTPSSSNPTLIPTANIILSGSGTNRAVEVTAPTNQTGSATITLTVSDGQAQRSTSFTIVVRPTQGGPSIEPLPDQVVLVDQPTDALLLKLSDPDTPLGALQLTGLSSNPALVPNENIFFGMACGQWYTTVTPLFGQTGSAVITLKVSDGTTESATQFQLTVNSPPPGTGRFINPSAMTIPPDGVADLYPSQITVSGMNGPITKLVLSIDKFSHANVSDVNMLLVSPGGQGVIIFSHVSGTRPASNVRVNLNDSSAYFLPQDFALWSEPLKPAAFSPTPVFPAPAPPGPYGPVALSTFNGVPANGIWSLYVFDDAASNGGSIVGGWSLLVSASGASSPPAISDIPDQTTLANTSTSPIPFSISDPDTPVEDLTLVAESSNQALVPTANIVFGGSGANRTLTITPAPNQFGTAVITVRVTDGAQTASRSFTLTVRPPPQSPAISDIPDQTTFANTATSPIPFSISDPDTPVEDLTLVAESSNQALVPTANIVFGGSGANRTLTITPAPNQAGTAIITVRVTDGVQTASDSFTLTVKPPVQKKTLTITVNSAIRLYGGSNPAFTGTLVGLENGDQISATYVTPATPSSPVGQYSIRPILSDPDGKLTSYTVLTNLGTLTVTSVPLLIRVDSHTRVYAAQNPALTGSIEGIQNGDRITATYFCSASVASSAGVYPITASLHDPDAKLGNYSVVVRQATLLVQPAPLAVQADDKSRLYGTENPPLTGTIAGIQNGDNITAEYSTTATQNSDVGNYPITPALRDPNNRLGNYQLTVRNGTLTISLLPGVLDPSQPSLDVTADDNTRAYGSANPLLTGTITGLQNGDNITATWVTSAGDSSGAGVYAIAPVFHDPNDKLRNYRLTTHYGVLTVTAASLDVQADNKSRGYGGANPPFTGSIVGLLNDDPILGEYATTATPASPIGSYPITPALNDPAGRLANYAVTLRHGLLTVKAAGAVRLLSNINVSDHFHISGIGDANFTYRIQSSTDLVQWLDLGTVQADSTGAFQFDGALPNPEACFFRVYLP